MSSFTNWFTALGKSDAWTTMKSADTIVAETEDEDRLNAENQAKTEADKAVAQKAATKKAEDDSLAAAAEAEAEKLRQRKGYKATILTGTDQDKLGAATTGKAAMMG